MTKNHGSKRRTDTPPQQPLEKLLTPIQVAETLGVTLDSARKRLSRGQIPGAVRLGGQWRVKQSVFHAWIEALPED